MHAKVSSGNVTVLIGADSEKAAMGTFEWLMRLGPPFDDSFLSDIAQIKNLETERVHYAIVRS